MIKNSIFQKEKICLKLLWLHQTMIIVIHLTRYVKANRRTSVVILNLVFKSNTVDKSDEEYRKLENEIRTSNIAIVYILLHGGVSSFKNL